VMEALERVHQHARQNDSGEIGHRRMMRQCYWSPQPPARGVGVGVDTDYILYGERGYAWSVGPKTRQRNLRQ
jgi:hypothetical protein